MQPARHLVAVRRDSQKRITHLIVARKDGIREALPVEEALKGEGWFYVTRDHEAILVDLQVAGGRLVISGPLEGPIDLPDDA